MSSTNDVEKLRERIQEQKKELDEMFNPSTEGTKQLLEQTKNCLKNIDEIRELLNSKSTSINSIHELRLLSAYTYMSFQLGEVILSRMITTDRQLKSSMYQNSVFMEFFMTLMPILNALGFKSKSLDEELKKLKDEPIKMEIRDDVAEALQEFMKAMDRAKKAWSQYIQ